MNCSAVRWELKVLGRLLCQLYRIILLSRALLFQNIPAVQSALYTLQPCSSAVYTLLNLILLYIFFLNHHDYFVHQKLYSFGLWKSNIFFWLQFIYCQRNLRRRKKVTSGTPKARNFFLIKMTAWSSKFHWDAPISWQLKQLKMVKNAP